MINENGLKIGMDLKCIGGENMKLVSEYCGIEYKYGAFKYGTLLDLTKNSERDKYGDILYCTDDCCIYIYDGAIWTKLFSDDEPNYRTIETHIIYPTNCKNCGAILHNHICEYCGSDNKERLDN